MRTGRIWLWIGFTLIVGMGLFWGGCSKDDPHKTDGVEIPSGPRDDRDKDDFGDKDNNDGDKDGDTEDPDGGENPEDNDGDEDWGSNNNEELEIPNDLTIVGDWSTRDGSVWFQFDAKQRFTAFGGRSIGFKVSQPSEVDGTYTFSDLKKHLWLSVNEEDEGIYVLEFRVVFEGEKNECMHLWSENNRETVVYRR